MTVVDINTGEVVEAVSADRARQITERIRLLAESVADGIDRLVERIHEAQRLGVHEALGYRSWTEYVSKEFAGVLPRLGREPRRELVATLTETGMSTRAIAPIVGADHSTVVRDIARGASAPPQTPSPEPRGEAEPGEGRTSSEAPSDNRGVEAGAATPEVQSERVEPLATAPRPTVTGIDGKTYSRPGPKRDADEQFWTDAADQAQASGFVAKRDAERPYSVAVIALCHAAEDVAGLSFEPEDLAAHVPAHVVYRLPEIEQMAEWLSRFVAATKESA